MDVGLIMSLMVWTYVISCILYPYLFAKIPRRLSFIIALLGESLALSLIGPSWILGLTPHKYLELVIIGLALIGVF